MLSIAAAIIATTSCFCAGWHFGKASIKIPEPTTEVRIDTVTVTAPSTDSVAQVGTVVAQLPVARPKPVEIEGTINEDDEPMDTIDYPYDNPPADSAAVEIPISRYVAEKDSLYRVVAEGYAVDFKEITVYPKTATITNTIEVRKPTRWGIGVQAGYGATLNNNTVKLAPYIGVGISYNIITW